MKREHTTLDRYVWLLNTLLRAGSYGLSLEELSQKWRAYSGEDELNRRTFINHREEVQRIFHIDIECLAANGYRYYIANADDLKNNVAVNWLLNSIHVTKCIRAVADMQDRVLLEDIPGGTNYLSTVLEAMQLGRELEIIYQPFYEEAPETYHVHPYCIKVHRQRWYVLGYFVERSGLRNFALDRTLDMKITDTHFTVPKSFNAEEYYYNSVGIWANESLPPQRVVIRAYGEQSQYLKTLALHHSQTVVTTTDGYTDFQYSLCVTQELIYELLSKGDTIEVVAPATLRDRLRNTAFAIAKRNK